MGHQATRQECPRDALCSPSLPLIAHSAGTYPALAEHCPGNPMFDSLCTSDCKTFWWQCELNIRATLDCSTKISRAMSEVDDSTTSGFVHRDQGIEWGSSNLFPVSERMCTFYPWLDMARDQSTTCRASNLLSDGGRGGAHKLSVECTIEAPSNFRTLFYKNTTLYPLLPAFFLFF